jgi:hypothetical protein
MQVITTRELKERLEELQGTEICLQGWIRSHRKQKNIGFIDFYDGTCFKNPQVVYDDTIADFAAVSAIHVGAAILAALTAAGELARGPHMAPDLYMERHAGGRVYMKPGVDSPQDIASRAFDAGLNAAEHGVGLGR